jgi:antitoxin MazE
VGLDELLDPVNDAIWGYDVGERTYNDAAMIKKLSAVGNSLGIIIEDPILDLLDITKDTLLEVTTDGGALIIRPLKVTRAEHVMAIADDIMELHAETFRKLAQ